MSLADVITARRIPLHDVGNPAHRDLVLRYVHEHATGPAQRALLNLIGEAAA